MSELALQVTTQSLFSEPQELLPFDGSAMLQPRFFDAQRSVQLFESLMQQTVWEQPEMIVFGKKHAQAGLSTWYADNGVDYEYSGVVRVAHPMTPLLDEVRLDLEKFTSASFNSVLVNLYRDGKDSVGWHSDNEAVNGREPTIASVSLGATRRFDLRHKATKETVRADLEDGSLLVMSGLSQHCWVHQIAKTKTEVAPRINLTFRQVERVRQP